MLVYIVLVFGRCQCGGGLMDHTDLCRLVNDRWTLAWSIWTW